MNYYHSCDLRKGRVSEPGRPYLITTTTLKRSPIFLDWNAGNLVAEEIRLLEQQEWVHSVCWVLMPDHLHWLFILRRENLQRIIRQLKSRSAIAINRHRCSSGVIWQPGFHDRALRKDEDIKKVARYIVANPLRAGLVEDLRDYLLWDAMWVERGAGIEF